MDKTDVPSLTKSIEKSNSIHTSHVLSILKKFLLLLLQCIVNLRTHYFHNVELQWLRILLTSNKYKRNSFDHKDFDNHLEKHYILLL